MSDCILWKGAVNNKGYGKRGVNYVNWLAHRYAYTQAKGPIPPGKIIMHTCNNRLCVNPDHLVAGTYKENMKGVFTKDESTAYRRRRWRQAGSRMVKSLKPRV